MPTSMNLIGLTNSNTISTAHTVATGDNCVSVGPITISSGITVTVSTGAFWVII